VFAGNSEDARAVSHFTVQKINVLTNPMLRADSLSRPEGCVIAAATVLRGILTAVQKAEKGKKIKWITEVEECDPFRMEARAQR
jgi:hypothetical protein